jgi:hypothetical protein
MCAALLCGLAACTDQQDLGKDARDDASTSEEPVKSSDGGSPADDVDGAAPVTEPADDAGSDDPDGSTAPPDEPDASLPPEKACDPTAPFLTSTWWSLPQNGEIDSAADAWLSADQLRVFFSDGATTGGGGIFGGPGGSLYEQRRTSKDDAFAGAKQLFVPSDPDPMDNRKATYGSHPTLTADLLTLVYANPFGWLMKSTRASANDMFPTPEWVAYDQKSMGDGQPAFALGDRELWFTAQHAEGELPPPFGSGDSNLELMRVSLATDAAEAEPVSELNSEKDDDAPALSADGLWIYWRSYRKRSNGDPGPAVYVAHRASSDEPFAHIEEVLDLGNVFPLWLSPDYCSLYYVGGGDVYEARRQQ